MPQVAFCDFIFAGIFKTYIFGKHPELDTHIIIQCIDSDPDSKSISILLVFQNYLCDLKFDSRLRYQLSVRGLTTNIG